MTPKPVSAVTNARLCSAPRAAEVVPVPLSTAPVPLPQPARSSRATYARLAGLPAGFRLRLGGGRCASTAIRYALLSALRSTSPARRPQTEAGFMTYSPRFLVCQPATRARRNRDGCRMARRMP